MVSLIYSTCDSMLGGRLVNGPLGPRIMNRLGSRAWTGLGYRTYVGSSRTGEPPIIKADNAPTKIMPASPDGSAKVPDRLAMGDETEKIVPREEARVDISTKLASRSGWFWRLRPPPSKMSVIRSQVSPA